MMKKERMTSRERLLCAINGCQPDRVPCTPDLSSMIPCRLTGKPFYDIHLFQNPYPPSEYTNPALGEAYLRAADYFGIDAWYMYGSLDYKTNSKAVHKYEIISKSPERIVGRLTIETPDGVLTACDTFFAADSPTKTEKIIKDLKNDFPKLRWLYPEITGYDGEAARERMKQVGERGIFCIIMGYPGFQDWIFSFNGNLEAMTYAYYDEPDLILELTDMQHRHLLRQAEMVLDFRPDVLFLGGSGTLTLQSPQMFRQMGLPTVKEITKMAKQANVPTMLHSCGKSWELLKILTEETDLNCLNPLEKPPMGDVLLPEAKRLYGDKICLMGNLHTTEVMLQGTPDDVEREARWCIDQAAAGGGYILSTGDQCGRDTPDENIFRMVEVCKTYGQY